MVLQWQGKDDTFLFLMTWGLNMGISATDVMVCPEKPNLLTDCNDAPLSCWEMESGGLICHQIHLNDGFWPVV